MPPSKLYLVGTCHVDPQGQWSLMDFLERIRPDHITIEYDPLGLLRLQERSRQRKDLVFPPDEELPSGELLRKIGAYEFEVSRYYAFNNNAIPHFVDVIPKDLPLDKLIEWGIEGFVKFARLTPEQLSIEIEKMYERDFSEFLRSLTPIERHLFTTVRDEHAASIIRTLDGRVVHVGGLIHSFGPYHNLYDRLADLNPKRIKLCDVDDL